MNKELIIVDDDFPFRERLSRSMQKKGFKVENFSNSLETIKRINFKKFDYAIVDMRLEGWLRFRINQKNKRKKSKYKITSFNWVWKYSNSSCSNKIWSN